MAFGTMRDVGQVIYPKPIDSTQSTPCLTNYVLNDATDRVAHVLQAPKTGVISKVMIRTGSITTSAPIMVTFQTVVSGVPSGSNFGGASSETLTSLAADTNYTITFSTGASVNAGDIFAYVIEPGSTPINLQIVYNTDMNAQAFPYSLNYNSGWNRLGNGKPIAGIGYSDGSFPQIEGIAPVQNFVGATDFYSSSNPDEYALKFQLPVKSRIAGIRWYHASFNGTFNIRFYTPSSTFTYTMGPSEFSTASRYAYYIFPTPVEVQANTVYRASLRAVTDTTRVYWTVFDPTFIGNADANCVMSTRVNDGVWTDTTNRMMLWAILDQFDDGAGGGGGGSPTAQGYAQ